MFWGPSCFTKDCLAPKRNHWHHSALQTKALPTARQKKQGHEYSWDHRRWVNSTFFYLFPPALLNKVAQNSPYFMYNNSSFLTRLEQMVVNTLVPLNIVLQKLLTWPFFYYNTFCWSLTQPTFSATLLLLYPNVQCIVNLLVISPNQLPLILWWTIQLAWLLGFSCRNNQKTKGF